MTKIKNFRITLRPREITRWLKNQHQIATTPEVELAVDAAVRNWKSLVQPASIYTTLTRTTAEKTTSIAFPNKAVAVSILAATIGPKLDPALASAATDGSPSEKLLMDAVYQEAVQQAVQFAMKLIGDQAKDEECELSEPVVPSDPGLVTSLANLLGTERIGLAVSGEPAAMPPYARLLWAFWSPVKKHSGRKSDASKQKAAA